MKAFTNLSKVVKINIILYETLIDESRMGVEIVEQTQFFDFVCGKTMRRTD